MRGLHTWSFESAPVEQKLHIYCKNKLKVGKVKLILTSTILFLHLHLNHIYVVICWQRKFGKVTIEIDRVVMVGEVADEHTLLPTSKSGQPRNLEVELKWSNKPSYAYSIKLSIPSFKFDYLFILVLSWFHHLCYIFLILLTVLTKSIVTKTTCDIQILRKFTPSFTSLYLNF